MSGPKGIAYQVRAAEEARRRAVATGRARCSALAEQVLQQASHLGWTERQSPLVLVRTASWETVEDPASIEAMESDVSALLHDIEGQVNAKYEDLARAQFTSEIAALAGVGSFDFDARPAERAPGVDVEALTARLERVGQVLTQLHDAEARAELIQELAIAVHESDAGQVVRAQQRLLSVQTEANRRLAAERAAQTVKQQVAATVLTIAHIATPAANEVRRAARDATTFAELDEIRSKADALNLGWKREQDRAYVVAETRRAFSELGYEIGADFIDACHAGLPTVLRRPDLPDHGLRIQFSADRSRLLTRVVTFVDPSPTRDAEVELTTCRDIEAVRSAWHLRGIHDEVDHHQEPGTVPVERVAGSSRERDEAHSAERNHW